MKKYIYILIGLLFLGGVVWLILTPGKPSKYDAFAQCIRDTKSVTFFGAFWCPHCQAQKARFGTAAKYLPYVECSTPDGQSQNKVCTDAGVQTYPTWQFNSSTTDRVTGELELAELAERTSCVLPE